MPKRFFEIKEQLRKTTVFTGSNLKTATSKTRKVPGYGRGRQPGTTKGQYKVAHKGTEVKSQATGSWDAPKDKDKYEKIYRERNIHEMGAGAVGGPAMSIGNSSVSPISGPQADPTAAAVMSVGAKKRLRMLFRKSPKLGVTDANQRQTITNNTRGKKQ